MYKQEYAVYKGDDILIIGNVEECAKYMGVSKSTIYWYSNKAAHDRNKTNNRIVCERVGDGYGSNR